jgi:hypothetical protein
MKMKRLAAFLLALMLDVKVRAVNIENPKGCLGKSTGACSVLTDHKPFEIFKFSIGEMRTSKGSSYTRLENGELELMRGLFWLHADQPVKVKTLYGELSYSGGAALIEVRDGQVKFTNLSASEFNYQPRGEGKTHNLPVGYATYFAGVRTTGVADAGFPHPAEMEPLIKHWTQLFAKSELRDFEIQFENFLKDWRVARSSVADWYRDTVDRAIASHEAELARQARLKAERDAAERVYRDLFRQRFLNP